MQSRRKSNEYMNESFSFDLDVFQGKVCAAGQRCHVEKQADGTFAASCGSASKNSKDQKGVQGNAKRNFLASLNDL